MAFDFSGLKPVTNESARRFFEKAADAVFVDREPVRTTIDITFRSRTDSNGDLRLFGLSENNVEVEVVFGGDRAEMARQGLEAHINDLWETVSRRDTAHRGLTALRIIATGCWIPMGHRGSGGHETVSWMFHAAEWHYRVGESFRTGGRPIPD